MSLYDERAAAWRTAAAEATTDAERRRAEAQAEEYERLADQARES